MSVQKINPPELYDGAAFGISQATVDEDSGLVFVSGQVDWDNQYQVRHSSLEEQTEGVLERLTSVLTEANASIEHLLQLRVYVRGELSEQMGKVVPLLVKYLGGCRPALTGVGVASLATPDTLIEIEALAKIAK